VIGGTLNFKELASAAIIGFTIGAVWVALSHVFSRPAGDGEVIFVAVATACIMTLMKRGRPRN
jgi:hypothetical protein